MLTVGSLFSGIGGFDLGLERAGMKVIWQSEIDPYASAVLRKHWPEVPNLGDIRTIDADRMRRGAIGQFITENPREYCKWIPDVICGGFPCQPFSSAGARAGKQDDRYLWPEMLRVIQELKPTWVCGENVTHIDGVALEDCIAGLEACGYQVAPPLEIPACAVGADHIRARIWFLGYANRDRESGRAIIAEAPGLPKVQADTERGRIALGRDVAGAWRQREPISRHSIGEPKDTAIGMGNDDGLPGRMDRLRCLGNSIHPAIAEIIGRAIVSAA